MLYPKTIFSLTPILKHGIICYFLIDNMVWFVIFWLIMYNSYIYSSDHRQNIEIMYIIILYRVSQKDIVFRNVVLFWLAGVWVFKTWVILGSKNIHAITRCLALPPMCLHLSAPPCPFTHLWIGIMIRAFAIFLKTISFWDTMYYTQTIKLNDDSN